MDANKKKWLAGGLAIVALAVLVIGGYQAWLRVPPAMPEDVDDLKALMASPRYQRLSGADKRPYQERINEMFGQLSREDRKQYQQFIREHSDARLEEQKRHEKMMRDTYNNMILNQSEAGRDVMLDMAINGMESAENRQRRAEMADRSNRTPEQIEQENEGIKRMWEWLDEGDPQTMGYGSEMFKLLQERRIERGLPPL